MHSSFWSSNMTLKRSTILLLEVLAGLANASPFFEMLSSLQRRMPAAKFISEPETKNPVDSASLGSFF